MSTNAEDFRSSFERGRARDGGRPMSTNAEDPPEFPDSFERGRARAMEADQ